MPTPLEVVVRTMEKLSVGHRLMPEEAEAFTVARRELGAQGSRLRTAVRKLRRWKRAAGFPGATPEKLAHHLANLGQNDTARAELAAVRSALEAAQAELTRLRGAAAPSPEFCCSACGAPAPASAWGGRAHYRNPQTGSICGYWTPRGDAGVPATPLSLQELDDLGWFPVDPPLEDVVELLEWPTPPRATFQELEQRAVAAVLAWGGHRPQTRKRRFWVSWEEKSLDFRPLREPPGPDVLDWWFRGSAGDNSHSTLVAWVEAQDEDAAKAAVQEDWPGTDRTWRFCREVEADWRPGTRFPLSDECRARLGASR
jgi:hypothetical protein